MFVSLLGFDTEDAMNGAQAVVLGLSFGAYNCSSPVRLFSPYPHLVPKEAMVARLLPAMQQETQHNPTFPTNISGPSGSLEAVAAERLPATFCLLSSLNGPVALKTEES